MYRALIRPPGPAGGGGGEGGGGNSWGSQICSEGPASTTAAHRLRPGPGRGTGLRAARELSPGTPSITVTWLPPRGPSGPSCQSHSLYSATSLAGEGQRPQAPTRPHVARGAEPGGARQEHVICVSRFRARAGGDVAWAAGRSRAGARGAGDQAEDGPPPAPACPSTPRPPRPRAPGLRRLPSGLRPQSRPPPLPRAGNAEPPGAAQPSVPRNFQAAGAPGKEAQSPAPADPGQRRAGEGRPRRPRRRRRDQGQPLPRAAGPQDPRGPTARGATRSQLRGPRPPGRVPGPRAAGAAVGARRKPGARDGERGRGGRGARSSGSAARGPRRPGQRAPGGAAPTRRPEAGGGPRPAPHLLLRPGELLLHVAGELPRRHPLAAHLRHRARPRPLSGAELPAPPPAPVRLPPRTGERRPRGGGACAREPRARRGPREGRRGAGRAGLRRSVRPARPADAAF